MAALWILLVLGVCLSHILCADLNCDSGRLCKKQKDCTKFLIEKNKLKVLTRGTSEFRKQLNGLKTQVCNKEMRKVCCTADYQTDSVSWVPSLKTHECGISIDPRFVRGGENTKLGEYPWTVLLGQTSPYDEELIWTCGGTLINKWYVLSAAHCDNVDMVRVGEWKVDSGDLDCFHGICSEKHQDIEPARRKQHPSYKKLPSGLTINDIMLIKLKTKVSFNNFVSPICLPDKQERRRLSAFGEPGKEKLLSYGRPVVVGWGRTMEDTDYDSGIVPSEEQMQLALPVVSNQKCINTYNDLQRKRSNGFFRDMRDDIRQREHICAGGELGKDSCKGDSGGPLIGRNGEVSPYVLDGVVAAGTKTCGIGAPAIFTRVTHYMGWILDNLN